MMGTGDLAKMVPGFEFLQSLMQGGAASLPTIGQWVAPTLDPAELDKRINDLRTVQFWLDQNARLIGATIQALEVQRMTLSTLQTMNLPMADLRDALKITPRPAPPVAAPEPAPSPEPARAAATGSTAAGPAVPAVDPLQWWGALTQQFTEIASKAMKDGAGAAAGGAKPVAAAGTAVKRAARPARPAGKRKA